MSVQREPRGVTVVGEHFGGLELRVRDQRRQIGVALGEDFGCRIAHLRLREPELVFEFTPTKDAFEIKASIFLSVALRGV